MTKHIHIHVGKTKDAGGKVTPSQIESAKNKANRILTMLNSSSIKDMEADDFAAGEKGLNQAINWFK